MSALPTQSPTIAFIGLGRMGWPMATRLVGAGFNLVVHDAIAGRAAAFAAQVGGRAASNAGEVAADATLLLTMLPTSANVRAVLFDGPAPAAPQLVAGSVVMDMTSGVPTQTRAIAAQLAERGVAMLDAPVSGGVKRAESGDLAFMVGGDAELLARCRSIIAPMARSIQHVGALGAGQAMKALNNLVSAGGFLISVEALLIGQKFGLDPAVMVDVLNSATGKNNSTEQKFKQFVLSRTFASGFALDLMVKDLSIALGIAEETHTAAPFARLCRELWAASEQTLEDGADHTALAQFCERLAGVQLGDGSQGGGG